MKQAVEKNTDNLSPEEAFEKYFSLMDSVVVDGDATADNLKVQEERNPEYMTFTIDPRSMAEATLVSLVKNGITGKRKIEGAMDKLRNTAHSFIERLKQSKETVRNAPGSIVSSVKENIKQKIDDIEHDRYQVKQPEKPLVSISIRKPQVEIITPKAMAGAVMLEMQEAGRNCKDIIRAVNTLKETAIKILKALSPIKSYTATAAR